MIWVNHELLWQPKSTTSTNDVPHAPVMVHRHQWIVNKPEWIVHTHQGFSTNISDVAALWVSPVVTRLTVYRRPQVWADSGWKRVVLRRSSSDRSQSVYKHRLDIKETFCYNGVTNESLWRVDSLEDRISRFQKCVIFGVLRPSACSKWRFTSNFAVHAQCGKIQWLIEQ